MPYYWLCLIFLIYNLLRKNYSIKLKMQEKTSKVGMRSKSLKKLNSAKTISCSTDPSSGSNTSRHSFFSPRHSYTSSHGRIPPRSSRTYTCSKLLKPLQKDKTTAENRFSSLELQEIYGLDDIFYLGNRREVNESNFDDKNGNYIFVPGDQLLFRFEILDLMGSGTFGTVVKCTDHKTGGQVAIKILKNEKIILECGKNEVKILNLLHDNEGAETYIVKKLENFWYRGHICIVFELLSIDLYEFIRKNNFQGLHINFAKRITVQILIALKHSHSLNVVHCDIKPENIVLKQENKSSVMLIDFGSAYLPGHPKYEYIQTRFYRAPEIILKSPWTEKIDIWSVGCLLIEQITGWPPFTGHSATEVLFSIVKLIGLPNRAYFNKANNLNDMSYNVLEASKKSFYSPNSSIDRVLEGHNKQLIQFVKKCLAWDPKERLSAEEALGHPWIKERVSY